MKNLDGRFYLAPLAGFTDEAFRTLCRREGAALSYTEMVSAKGLHYSNQATEHLLKILPREGPVGIQLFGSEPEMIAEAVEKLADWPNVLIDLNMGCPVPKVVKNGEGSALLRTPDLAARCVEAAVKASKDKPVTIKMRIGFEGKSGLPDGPDAPENYEYSPSPGELPAAEFAKLMERAGASAIVVHGRTREQYYSGKADWDAIKAVREAVSVPVIANGDIFSAHDGMRILGYTGCQAAMVARGALGNPWIFRQLNAAAEGREIPSGPSVPEIIDKIMEQLELTAQDKGEYTALREMRKHASFYTKGLRGSNELRTHINSANTVDQFREILDRLR